MRTRFEPCHHALRWSSSSGVTQEEGSPGSCRHWLASKGSFKKPKTSFPHGQQLRYLKEGLSHEWNIKWMMAECFLLSFHTTDFYAKFTMVQDCELTLPVCCTQQFQDAGAEERTGKKDLRWRQ